MALAVTHSTTATLPDQAGVEINKAEWNANHAIAGLGTGVETALGVNVGTDGAFVVKGGALGTPASGNVTNCTGQIYTLQSTHAAANPGDGQTVYIGNGGVPSTTAAIFVVPVPVAGTIIRVDVEVGVSGTLGTTEQATISLRLNNTTDTQITAVAQYNAIRQAYTAAVSITVAAGDYFQIKVVQPTWVTNPTQIVVSSVITVRT